MTSPVPMLEKIHRLNITSRAVTHEPISPRIQACADAGLLTLTPLRVGPLGLLTGEYAVRLTDDGQKLLSAEAKR